jgi:hypothetical protein
MPTNSTRTCPAQADGKKNLRRDVLVVVKLPKVHFREK